MLRKLFSLILATSMLGAAEMKSDVMVKTLQPDGALSKPHAEAVVVKTEAQWQAELPPKAFYVLRKQGTEAPFSGSLLKNKAQGIYTCAACELPLYPSDAKFDSGTGWPSFCREVFPGNVARTTDSTLGMERTELECARCGGHLGHVFDDGPAPTGERHCINSVSLHFVAKPEAKP